MDYTLINLGLNSVVVATGIQHASSSNNCSLIRLNKKLTTYKSPKKQCRCLSCLINLGRNLTASILRTLYHHSNSCCRLGCATKLPYVLTVAKTGMIAFKSKKYSFNRPCPLCVIRYSLRAFPKSNSQSEAMSPRFSKRLSSGYIEEAPKRIPNLSCTLFKIA